MKIFKGLLLSLLLLTSICFAEEPTTFPQGKSMGFRGLDTKSSPTAIENGRAQDLLNVQFTTTDGLKKRYGYSLVWMLDDIDGDYTAITGIYYNKYSDTSEDIIVIEGNKIFVDGTAIASPTITDNKNNQFVFATALDTVIATNDVNPVIEINKSTASALNLTSLGTDAPTKVKCVAWFQNFLILGNTYENSVDKPTRIRWSNIGYTETWTEADRNDIAELGGQEVNAFVELYNDLYIFLTNSVWKMSYVGGDEQFKFTKVLDEIGCIAKNSVQNVILQSSQRGILFLTKNKEVFFFNGVSAVEVSEIISPTLDDWNADRLPYVVSERTADEYRIYGTTGASNSTNNEVLSFNYSIGEWSRFEGEDINAVARVTLSNIEYTYGGNYKSCVFKLDNSANKSDIDGVIGTVDAVNVYTNSSASGLQIIYDASAAFSCTGATVILTGGTGSSATNVERVIVDCTSTGIMVDSAFSTTPSTDTTYSIGAIESYYQTKDYDLGDASLWKSLTDLFLWAKEQGAVTLNLNYKADFAGTVASTTISQDGGGGLWGTAIWGTAIWGGQSALLERVKLLGECRYVNFKITENDIDEGFDLYGWNILFIPRKHY